MNIEQRISATGAGTCPCPVPSNMWRACVEVRIAGSLGVFTEVTLFTRAEDEEKAREWILDDIYLMELEPRFIKTLTRVPR